MVRASALGASDDEVDRRAHPSDQRWVLMCDETGLARRLYEVVLADFATVMRMTPSMRACAPAMTAGGLPR
jgi:hypothetical protein